MRIEEELSFSILGSILITKKYHDFKSKRVDLSRGHKLDNGLLSLHSICRRPAIKYRIWLWWDVALCMVAVSQVAQLDLVEAEADVKARRLHLLIAHQQRALASSPDPHPFTQRTHLRVIFLRLPDLWEGAMEL